MGRGRSSSPRAKRGTPERKASKPAPKPAAKPTAQASKPTPAAPKPTQTMANQQPHAPKAAASSTPAHTTPQAVPAQGGGRSLMGEIAANAASTAAGVVGAHAIMGALGMGGHGHSSEKEEASAAPEPQQYQQVQAEPMNQQCSNQYQTFMKCLEANPSNAGACQWALDMFNQCKGMSSNSSERFL